MDNELEFYDYVLKGVRTKTDIMTLLYHIKNRHNLKAETLEVVTRLIDYNENHRDVAGSLVLEQVCPLNACPYITQTESRMSPVVIAKLKGRASNVGYDLFQKCMKRSKRVGI